MRRRPAILVLRGGAVGDFILTLPALQALREAWPEALIELTGYPEIAELARVGGWVDRVVSLHQARIARLYVLKGPLDPELRDHLATFDRIVAYLHDPEGSVARNLQASGVRSLIHFSPVNPPIHAADYLLSPLVRELGLAPGPAVPKLPLPDFLKDSGRARLSALGVRGLPLVLHPGSGSPSKNWPLPGFFELAERRLRSGGEVLFLAGEAEGALVPDLQAFCQARGCPLVKEETLVNIAALMSACGTYVGNDSGLTHLAAALGLRTVALFGPTDPAIWAPRGSRVQILRAVSGRWADLGVDEVEAALREPGSES